MIVWRWIAAVRRFFQKRPPLHQLPLPLLLAPPKRKPSLELPSVIYLPGPSKSKEDLEVIAIHQSRRYKGLLASAEGRFYFKDDVLDQLDYYFKAIRRFKLMRDDVYDLVSQVGINLIPDRSIYISEEDDVVSFQSSWRLEPWFVETLPGFGAYCYGTAKKLRKYETKKQVMHTRFCYFTRYAKKGIPITVQPVKEGAVYVVGLYFDQTNIEGPRKIRREQKTGLVEMPVLVAHDGTITALKVLETKSVHFPKKKRRGYCHEPASRSEWGFPQVFQTWAKDHKTTPENYICWRFLEAARMHGNLNSSMIRVHITKDDLAAVMNVDMERTPYFFKDRQPVIIDGIKKRIFHIVRPHERSLGNISADVHMHFRGLRKFNWNSYDVAITVPGWDHANWAMADFSAFDEESEKGKKIKKPVSMKELGTRVVENMRSVRVGR